MKVSASPMVSSSSSVRAWMPSARLCAAGAAPLSMMRVRIAAGQQLRCERQAGRTCADDQHLAIGTGCVRGHGSNGGRREPPDRQKNYVARYVFRAEQAFLVRPGGQLGAGAEAQLGQDVVDVHLDRAHREIQLAGDLAVGQAAGHQRRDLRLTPGEARATARLAGVLRLFVETERERLVERQPASLVEELRRSGADRRANRCQPPVEEVRASPAAGRCG